MAAESLDDGEFWLPPKFLTDNDDIFTETAKTKTPSGLKNTKDLFGFDAPLFPLEFPYGFDSFRGGVGLAGGGGFSSDLSSPVESVVESTTETESSDEEDYLAGLTGQMGRSTLEDLDFLRNDKSFATENTKGRVVSGSPQSTLCSVGSGCGCGRGSSHGSPNRISGGGVSAPPATWDLLYAAAGEVAKMRRDDEELYGAFNNNNNNNRVVAPPPRKPSPVTVPLKNNPDVGLYHQQQQQQYQSVSYQKLQASQFHHMRQQQMIKQHQQQQISGVWGQGQGQVAAEVNSNRGRSTNNIRAPLGLSASAWPSLQAAANPPPPPPPQQQQQQPQSASGMRAVFLGNPGTKRECVGTGVFLPRRIGTPTESRKKPVSTVLLPARVVQALNLNLEDMGAQPQYQPRVNGASVPDSAAASRGRKSNVSQQKHNLRQQQGMNVELRLPQEWTY